MFNLCNGFFSGYYFFKEEFASSLLGYLLSPFEDHDLKYNFLKDFLDILEADDKEIKDNINSLKKKLETMKISDFLNYFTSDPFDNENEKFRFSVALEYSEIDILLKIDDYILVIENKIHDGSIGDVQNQINCYCKKIDKKYHIIPIIIFPSSDNIAIGNFATACWNGNNSLINAIKKYENELNSISDFLTFAKQDFLSSCRTTTQNPHSYDIIFQKFSLDYQEGIAKFFDKENTVTGFDNSGGSLIYKVKFANTEIFPFRITVNSTCAIQYQGLKKDCYLNGKPFDNTHTIRDIIRLKLELSGISFINNGYSFNLHEFQNDKKVQALKDIVELLELIHDEKWSTQKFCEYWEKISKTTKTKNEIFTQLDSIKEKINKMSDDEFKCNYKKFITLFNY